MSRRRGFGLIDVIVGTALLLIVFLSLFGVLRASLVVAALARAEAGATSVAETQMEYLRGLSYDAVGTVGGIPSGAVPQTATTTENGIAYVTHTFIEYVDDPADGVGVNDTNGITTDYKRAEVTVTYEINGLAREVRLVSNFAPPGLETTNGGGTLEIDVVNAGGDSVPDATVVITNAAVTPAVDLTAYTNIAGTVVLPGAATSTEYQVSVSKSGYSSAQTYALTGTNQDPNPGYLTVAANQTTVGTFAIDLLATLTLKTYSPIATSTFADDFADASKLAAMSSTTVSGGTLTLESSATTGSARSVATTSPYLVRWGSATATTTGAVKIHVYDGSGNLLPDAVLANNSTGFTTFPVSLAAVSTTTYPSLALGATFTGTSTVPTVTGWSLSYAAGPTPLPDVGFTLTGAKTIGSTGGGAPIYKTTVTGSTGASGTTQLSLEWDSYTLSVSNYDIEDACPSPPIVLPPGVASSTSLILGSPTANYLRVLVLDNKGNPVGGATVTLSRSGFSETAPSSSCGSAYFGDIANATDYTVTITKAGYTTTSFSGVSVSGASMYSANFP
ncbi:MAG TPA: carboxypeptidase-like regulatory domain-containing protein [Candidatus Paceibacterota bacterium]|nr:carboxypeptidase-like regulatory domain-containing protein [Candidatus Paceibacterota bacterium]